MQTASPKTVCYAASIGPEILICINLTVDFKSIRRSFFVSCYDIFLFWCCSKIFWPTTVAWNRFSIIIKIFLRNHVNALSAFHGILTAYEYGNMLLLLLFFYFTDSLNFPNIPLFHWPCHLPVFKLQIPHGIDTFLCNIFMLIFCIVKTPMIFCNTATKPLLLNHEGFCI